MARLVIVGVARLIQVRGLELGFKRLVVELGTVASAESMSEVLRGSAVWSRRNHN